MNFIPATNGVLIRPIDINAKDGVVRIDFQDPHCHMPVRGVVVGISGVNYESPKRLRRGNQNDKREAEEREGRSLPWDVPCEVKAGDTVIYSYHVNRDKDDEEHAWQFIDGCLLIPYENLYARVWGGLLYPLNGLVLFEPTLPTDEVTGKPRAFRNRERPGGGIVRYEGCLVKEYADEGKITCDEALIGIGKQILIHPGFGVPIEDEAYADPDFGPTLWRIHRRHIVGMSK